MNTISKGTIFKFNNDYSIYEVNDNNLKYYITVPNDDTYTITLYIGLTLNDYNLIDKDTKEKEIDEIASKIYKLNPNSVYLLPILDLERLNNAISDNDDYFYNKLLLDLQKRISDVYSTINANNSVSVNNIIYGIKQNNEADKFLDWLECKLPEHFKIKNITDITKKYNQTNLEHTQLFSLDDIGSSDGGTALSGGTGDTELVNSQTLVKKKTPPKPSGKHGFSNITFSILIIGLAIVLGIIIAVMILQ